MSCDDWVTGMVLQVGLMESIAVAKSLADKNRYDINANQELAGVSLQFVQSPAWELIFAPYSNNFSSQCLPFVRSFIASYSPQLGRLKCSSVHPHALQNNQQESSTPRDP